MLRGHTGAVRRIGLRADGDLVTMAEDGAVRVWHPAADRRRLFVGGTDVFRLAWSPKSDALGAGARDGSVRWFAGLENTQRPLGRHQKAAYGMAMTPDGRTLISGGWDGTIGIWPIDGSAPRHLEQGSQVWNVVLDPEGRRLASIGDDGSVKLWDLASGEGHEVFRHHGQTIDVAFSPDGLRLASLGTDGGLHLQDLRGGTGLDLDAGAAGANALAFGKDGRHIYVTGLDGAVRDFDLSVARPEARVLTRHARLSRTVAVSPDGRTLASGGGDGEVHLVDLASGRVRALVGHTDEARHVTFSPDGRLLASASWDGTVRVWDLSSGATTVLRAPRQKAHRVAFSPDGKWLASTGSDGAVSVWPVARIAEDAAPTRGLVTWLAGRTTATLGMQEPLATR
jgi:WD40 repeat protein